MADKRPGVMIYFSIMNVFEWLDDAEAGQLFKAIMEYGKFGVLPEFTGMLGMAWGFVQPLIDRDAEKYERTIKKRQYAGYCKSCISKNIEPVSMEEWEATICNHVVTYETNNNTIPIPNTDTIPVSIPITTPIAVTNTTTMTVAEGSMRGDGDNDVSPWPKDAEERKRAQIKALREGEPKKN